MKRILLASAACFALSLPAMAAANQPAPTPQSQNLQQSKANQPAKNEYTTQGQAKPAQNENMSQNQANQPSQAANNQQAQIIRPSSLNKQQVREIQMKLNKAGFSAGHDDGIWGPDTDTAIRDYQKAKKLPGSGELNQQTLADLGVKLNNQTASSSNQNMNGQGQAQSKSNEQSLSSGTAPASGTNGQANSNAALNGSGANGSNANGQTATTSNHAGSMNNNAGSNTKP